MRVFQIMAVLAMATLLGCGGGGGDDDGELRTSIACFDAQGTGCASVRSDGPTEMTCEDGAREVEACPEEGVRATCTASLSVWDSVLRVYSSDPAVLARFQRECASAEGTWQVTAP